MERLAARRNQKQRKIALASLVDPDVIYEKLVAISNEKNEGMYNKTLIDPVVCFLVLLRCMQHFLM